MIGFYDYTVIATYLATALSVCGIFQAINGHLLTAVICLLVSGLLDTVDGKIARTKKDRTAAQKNFGIQIDSLNDVICFGALPAVIAYAVCRGTGDTVPLWYVATLCFFVLCGLIRLAYFNVLEEERMETEGGVRTYYLGLPITASTLLFPLLCVLTSALGHPQLIMGLGLFLTGLLYVTPLHVPKPQTKAIIILACVGAAELAALCIWGI